MLVEIIQRGQNEGVILRGDSEPFVMTAWATMHGLATLFIDGLPGDWQDPRSLSEKADELSQQIVIILTSGFQATASSAKQQTVHR